MSHCFGRRAFVAALFISVPLFGTSGLALAQGAQAPAMSAAATPVLALTLAPAKGDAKLTVSSNAFDSGKPIPDTYTQYDKNVSPPLTWSAGPSGTVSYAVITEDSGIAREEPIIHWVAYDIPATAKGLPQDVAKSPKPASPTVTQGMNIAKKTGYMGPKPPAGQVHPYHFEVFALDATLGLDPNTTDRNALVAAMKGHVLASGELVGTVTGH